MTDDHIVAVGSLNDCELLVENFSRLAGTSLSFINFARLWKNSNFELIFWYVGRRRGCVNFVYTSSSLFRIFRFVNLFIFPFN